MKEEFQRLMEVLDNIDEQISDIKQKLIEQQPDYCEIGSSHCACGWENLYPVSGCPKCHRSFVE